MMGYVYKILNKMSHCFAITSLKLYHQFGHDIDYDEYLTILWKTQEFELIFILFVDILHHR
jgi:hypothetical protein